MSPAEAQTLIDAGLSYAEVAQRAGVAKSTLYRWLNPSYAEWDRRLSRQAKERRRRSCEDCGAQMAYDNARGICHSCLMAAKTADTRERILDAFQRWERLYGSPPVSTDWNPQHARAVCGSERLAEIETRHEQDGPWPSVSEVQRVFGSWRAGIEAAGFTIRQRRAAA